MAIRAHGTRVVVVVSLVWVLASVVPVAFGQPDPEPNDQPALAVPIRLQYTYYAGAIVGTGDVDYFKFEVDAGREISIWLEAQTIGSGLVPILALHDAAGKILAYNDQEFHLGKGMYTPDPVLYIKIPASGTYYISVRSDYNFRTNKKGLEPSEGPYQLYLLNRFDSTLVHDECEPNDTRARAYPVVPGFHTRYAELNYIGDIDWYSFDAARGQRFTLDIDAIEKTDRLPEPFVVKSRLGVFDDAGHLLASSAGDPDPDSGFAEDPAIIFEAPKAGRYYVAVTARADTGFTTLLGNQAFLSDPAVGSLGGTIGYYYFRIDEVRELLFPHIANGNFGQAAYSTTFLLVNTADEQSAGQVRLFKSDGTPLEVTFLPSGVTGSSLHFTIPPGGGFSFRTDGEGDGSSGYAIVTSGVGIEGSVVFSQFGPDGRLQTEAGVPPSPGMDFFAYPVEIRSGVNTGMAVANMSGTTRATTTMRLVDAAGRTFASRSLTLEPGQQTAVFVAGPGQLFPTVTTFSGSLQVTSDVPLQSIALRSTTTSLTTLPPVRMNQSYQAVTLNFPHVVAGPGYRSTLMLTNPGYFQVTGSVQYTRSDGSPMRVGTGQAGSSRVDFSIPALGSLFLESAVSSALETGFATLRADHGLGGLLVISQVDPASGAVLSEVGIPSAGDASRFYVFAESEGDYNTGLALANAGSGSADIVYRLRPAGSAEAVERGPESLAPGRHVAELVAGPNQLFPDYTGVGALEVTSTTPVPAVALRITSTTMTSLPVIRIY